VATAGPATFGFAAAVSGTTAVIGAPGAKIGASAAQGAVYFFTQAGGTWTQQQELFASDPAADARFGNAVALSGGTLVVGTDPATGPGAAYVFTLSGATWTFAQKLTASDGATGDLFAAASEPGMTPIAISGTTIFLSAAGANNFQGAVYVFGLVGASYVQQQKLVASDAAATPAGACFGCSVAASNNMLVAGAPLATIQTTPFVGAAYVFTASGGTWTQQAELLPPAAEFAMNPNAGVAVGVSGSSVFVGAVAAPSGTTANAGAVYVYTASGGTFGAPVKAVASDPNGGFGGSLAVSGSRLIVGDAPTTAAYVFDAVGGAYVQQAKLLPPDGLPNAFFADAVAFDGATLLVGSMDLLSGNNSVGEAFIGALTPPGGPTGDGGSADGGATGTPDAGTADTGATAPPDAGHGATTDAGPDATTDAGGGALVDATRDSPGEALTLPPRDATAEDATHEDASASDASKVDSATAETDGATTDTGNGATSEGDGGGTFDRETPSCSCRMAGERASSTPLFAAAIFACGTLARRRGRARRGPAKRSS
jgi:hypothetical protein